MCMCSLNDDGEYYDSYDDDDDGEKENTSQTVMFPFHSSTTAI